MAWISVHESIVGKKLRNLRKELDCSQWEAEGILCSLWLWGLSNADRDGLLEFADRDDVAFALSGSSAGSSILPLDAVNALIESGWIDETERGLCIHDWTTWQEQWYKAKAKREYDAKRKREERQKRSTDDPSDTEESDDSPQDSPATGLEPQETKKKSEAPKYGSEFEEFWKIYPRKDEKAGAYKCYCTRLKEGFSETQMLEAAKAYAAQCAREHTEKKYTKLARTFLGPSTPFVDFLPNENRKATKQWEDPDTENPFASYEG